HSSHPKLTDQPQSPGSQDVPGPSSTGRSRCGGGLRLLFAAGADAPLIHAIGDLAQHPVERVALAGVEILEDPVEVRAPFRLYAVMQSPPASRRRQRQPVAPVAGPAALD